MYGYSVIEATVNTSEGYVYWHMHGNFVIEATVNTSEGYVYCTVIVSLKPL